MKLKIGLEEQQTEYVKMDYMEIDTDDFPTLPKFNTVEELKQYLDTNIYQPNTLPLLEVLKKSKIVKSKVLCHSDNFTYYEKSKNK